MSTVCLSLSMLGGCASYGVVVNTPVTDETREHAYSLKAEDESEIDSDFVFILTFSGGGTRAAAMAYGVLEELRDTNVSIDGQQKRLLDEIDRISSVSGGSFTAAYYGLHGEGIFDIFEDDFLRVDVEKALKASVFNPLHWFGRTGRTQRAIEYYQKNLFQGATFADMNKPGRPTVIINTSDLAYGVRFSFLQGYFNFLCSDLSTFPVANAVAASSSVPVVFNPVVIENFADCDGYDFVWPADVEQQAQEDANFAMLYEGLMSYSDKNNRKYIHFVDGGITDNMGLRAIPDIVALAGGPEDFLRKMQRKPPSHVVLISVNASTEKSSDMDQTSKQPGILTAMNAMTDVQLHRYNTATIELVQTQLVDWAESLSTPEHPVSSHFIQVSFDEVKQVELKLFLNKIPTSFGLTNEQVDALIQSARTLLRENPDYQQLLAELAKQ